MSLLEQLRQRREEILAIGARRGVTHVRVFGSVARGEERGDSDVDLLIELEPQRSLIDQIGFGLDLSKLLGRKVEAFTPLGIHEWIRDSVLREAVEL